MAEPFVVPASSPSRRWRARLRRGVLVPARRLTAGLRCWPDTLIAGVQKGGTTPFFRFLAGHPQVLRGLVKEPHYFDRHFARGPAWYRAHFPLRATRARAARRAGGPVRVLDATPDALFDPRAAPRVGRDLPHARSIVLLRDPVDRAYSHYQMMVARELEPLSFADAVEAEAGRLEGEWELIRDDPDRLSHPLRLHSYLARGRYAEQLARWWAHLPRSSTLVLVSEDARRDPQAAFDRITDHLGIARWRPPSFAPPNARRYAPMDPGLRRELQARFREPNRELEALLGREMGWG